MYFSTHIRQTIYVKKTQMSPKWDKYNIYIYIYAKFTPYDLFMLNFNAKFCPKANMFAC